MSQQVHQQVSALSIQICLRVNGIWGGQEYAQAHCGILTPLYRIQDPMETQIHQQLRQELL